MLFSVCVCPLLEQISVKAVSRALAVVDDETFSNFNIKWTE